jgi:hypothetical protein
MMRIVCKKDSFSFRFIEFLKKYLFKDIELIECSGENIRGKPF